MAARLGIVAGGGTLPRHLIDSCRASSRPFFVVALEGQADPASVADTPHAWVRLGAAGEVIARLRAEGCAELVFAGSVRRPSLTDLRPDGWTAWFLARTGAFALGDDGLLTTLANALEREEGFRVIAPEAVIPELLAREGAYSRLVPSIEDQADIAAAIAAAIDLGARDQGQAAVARDGYAVALEHADGTDAMLTRLAAEPPPSPPKGVLAKVKKPNQEARIDLPTIGPETVRLAARAGLRGIVIEAGGSLVVDANELARAADEAGLFVAGVRVPHPPVHPIRPPPTEGPLIFLVAGEPSGDTLGARLMAAIKAKTDNRVRFVGVGGDKMAAEGLVSLFPMREIAVMGLLEVLPRLPNILARIDETVERAEYYNPDALVTIDSPDFNFRVARRLKGLDFPRIHYVAPTVWAWRPGRARKIARFLDRLIALLPFEPPYFEREGLACVFVGHPVLESGAGAGDGKVFRARHDIAPGAPVLCVLPGSRRSEVRALLAPLGVAVYRVSRDVPGLRVVVPTLAAVADDVRAATAAWPGAVVIEGEGEKYDAFAAANAALAASGTVSLELAMAGLPHAIAYKVSPVTAWIARRLIRVRFVNLVNLVLENPVVPEFLQENCTGERLADAALKLLRDADARKAQTDAFTETLRRLGQGQDAPSARAAEVVLTAIAEYQGTTAASK